MRRVLTVAVFAVGCATTPSPPPEAPANEFEMAWDAQIPALQSCYRAYLTSFGGHLDGGPLQPSSRGPTVEAEPWEGEVAFSVSLAPNGREVGLQPSPDLELAACWSESLAAANFPSVSRPTTIRRTVSFSAN